MLRIVSTHAGAVFEDARLAYPQVHDAAFVHQVIGYGKDKAGMRLRALIGVLALLQLAGRRLYIIVALRLAGNAVRIVQAGIEPLRRIRRAALGEDGEYELVVEDLRVLLESQSSRRYSPSSSSTRPGDAPLA